MAKCRIMYCRRIFNRQVGLPPGLILESEINKSWRRVNKYFCEDILCTQFKTSFVIFNIDPDREDLVGSTKVR